MSYPVKLELRVLAVILICITIFCCSSGKAEEDVPEETGVSAGDPAETGLTGGYPAQTGVTGGYPAQTGVTGGGPAQTGFTGGDPAQTGVTGGYPAETFTKALLCLNDKYIYSSCEESYRLTESGDLNVPLDYTDQYCTGPCLKETHLALNCIENIMSHFVFHNRATIRDVRDTIKEGCGHGLERGNFHVAEHIEAEENRAHKAVNRILFGFGLIIVVHGLLLG